MKKITYLGDTHGDWNYINNSIIFRESLRNSIIIHVGDCGLGFSLQKDIENLKSIDESLGEVDSKMLIVRGNHSSPSFWQDSKKNQELNSKFKNIQFIPDYYSKEINGRKFLFVGGGISIDRMGNHRVEGKSYWKDEPVTWSRFPITKHDVVVSHSCPSYFPVVENVKGDIVDNWSKVDLNLLEDLKEERQILDHVFDCARPKDWYFGHFHNKNGGVYEGCNWRCVDINEFLEDERN